MRHAASGRRVKHRSAQPPLLTAQTLQNKVELAASLKGIEQVHDKRVPDGLQDLALGSGVSCVLRIAHDLGLGAEPGQ